MNERVLFLDTDIGDDIDDALALLFLLKLGECKLDGISTVYANTNLRSRLTRKILSLANREDIPVYSGKRSPFSGFVDVNRSFIQYTDDLNSEKYQPIFNDSTVDEGEAAIDAMIASAKKYKERLTILGIGPYTNVATAIAKDIKAFKNVRIVLMGGCYYEQFIEYNVQCDPVAAKMIFQSDLDIRLIGADVTWQVQLNDSETEKILSIRDNGLMGYTADLVRLWKKSIWFNPVLHDPLAAYYALDESICELEKVWVEVETTGEHSKGLTLNMDHIFKYLQHKKDKQRVWCAKTVDKKRIIADFLKSVFDFKD